MDKDKPAFSETVPIKLKELGYIPPIIKSYDKGGLLVRLEKALNGDPIWCLYVDGVQWMTLDSEHSSTSDIYSQYYLAYGHVICTGLGFGVREQWLATKPEVTKITVLEKFKKVIDYHKDIGTKWSDKIEIINVDANNYKGSCNFLAIDHYELDDVLTIRDSIKRICKNITCECTWFWLLEPWIDTGHILAYSSSGHGPYSRSRTVIRYGGKENDAYENYIKIKKYFDIDKLPFLKESELIKLINMFWSTDLDQEEISTRIGVNDIAAGDEIII